MYASPASLARAAMVVLAIGACLDAVGILSTMSQIELIERVKLGEELADGVAEANDDRQQFIGVVRLFVYIATVITFLRWLNRAYRNLPALSSRHLLFTPGWAVGAWFVPFLNLVRPFQIMRETWWISAEPGEATRTLPGITPPTPLLVGAWWGAFLLSGVVGRMAFSTARRAESIPQLLDASRFAIASDITGIVAGLLAIGVIRTISKNQDAEIARVNPGGQWKVG